MDTKEQPDGHAKGLIERLEAAEVGSRELDAEIAVFFGIDGAVALVRPDIDTIFGHQPGWCRTAYNSSVKAPPVTTSLDAALSLAERVVGESHAITLLQDALSAHEASGLSSRQIAARLCAMVVRMKEQAP